MKHIYLMLLLFLAAGCFVLPVPVKSQDQAKPKPKPAQQVQQQEPQEEYTEEEYDAYEKAVKEPDLDKRAQMLFAFMEKYPKSKLMPYIDQSYQTLAYDYSKGQNWDKLLPLAEQWLKTHPNDLQTIVYIAEAAQKLGKDQIFLEYGEKIYSQKPTANMAYYISQSYKKLGNEARYLEWTEKLFSYPEFAGDFGLRLVFVDKYTKEKKFDKAAEYAQLALKSLEVAKKPETTTDAKWKADTAAVRRICYFTIGVNYYEKERCPDAIKYFQLSLRIEKLAAPYYYIGHCQWKTDKVEEAIDSFAKAVLLKGEVSSQAKEYLEKLYKALHNQTTIGIEKVYKRNQQELDEGKP
jgi:tetratricopeptide (TPR) repeat protein